VFIWDSVEQSRNNSPNSIAEAPSSNPNSCEAYIIGPNSAGTKSFKVNSTGKALSFYMVFPSNDLLRTANTLLEFLINFLHTYLHFTDQIIWYLYGSKSPLTEFFCEFNISLYASNAPFANNVNCETLGKLMN
jgi:hypothetical protein